MKICSSFKDTLKNSYWVIIVEPPVNEEHDDLDDFTSPDIVVSEPYPKSTFSGELHPLQITKESQGFGGRVLADLVHQHFLHL